MENRILVFLLLGFTAMLADMVYEGGRSVLGPYLSYLEAPLLVIGAVSIGDVVGYLMRGVSGGVAFRLGESRAWILLILGYGMNAAIPLLALAGSPGVALLLVVLERAGKGVRAPVKDSLIASLTSGTRLGSVAYGVHEVLDQLGAVSGPLIIAYTLTHGSYRDAFQLLWTPYLLSMAMLLLALYMYRMAPPREPDTGGYSTPWRYIVGVSLPMAGFIHWALAGAVLSARGWGPEVVAAAYSIAMGVDVLLAIPMSLLYNATRGRILFLVPIASIGATLSALYAGPLVAGATWGLTMVMYETVVKAGLARQTSGRSRMAAFGIMGLLHGLVATLGNIIIALLIGSVQVLVVYLVIVGVTAMILLGRARLW